MNTLERYDLYLWLGMPRVHTLVVLTSHQDLTPHRSLASTMPVPGWPVWECVPPAVVLDGAVATFVKTLPKVGRDL